MYPASAPRRTGCASCRARKPSGIIYGRSDATINGTASAWGTAELYRAVEALPEIVDSLVVDLEYLGRESAMLLFVVAPAGGDAGRVAEAAHPRVHP